MVEDLRTQRECVGIPTSDKWSKNETYPTTLTWTFRINTNYRYTKQSIKRNNWAVKVLELTLRGSHEPNFLVFFSQYPWTFSCPFPPLLLIRNSHRRTLHLDHGAVVQLTLLRLHHWPLALKHPQLAHQREPIGAHLPTCHSKVRPPPPPSSPPSPLVSQAWQGSVGGEGERVPPH